MNPWSNRVGVLGKVENIEKRRAGSRGDLEEAIEESRQQRSAGSRGAQAAEEHARESRQQRKVGETEGSRQQRRAGAQGEQAARGEQMLCHGMVCYDMLFECDPFSA
jgi:hypothetical protein